MSRTIMAVLGALVHQGAFAQHDAVGYEDTQCQKKVGGNPLPSSFCSDIGKCLQRASGLHVGYYETETDLWLGNWGADDNCKRWETATSIRKFEKDEARKYYAGECAIQRSHKCEGCEHMVGKASSVRITPGCQQAGGCVSCVSQGLKSTVKTKCKTGATKAAKKVIKDNLGNIIGTLASAVSGDLDSQPVLDLEGEAMEDACATCLKAIATWLKSESPKTCSGSQSCNHLDWAAGNSMLWVVDLDEQCSAASQRFLSSGKTLSLWYDKATCSGTKSSNMVFPSGQFCGGLGRCWTTQETDPNLRYMKWFAHENKLYTVFWSASLGICGTLDNYQFLD